MRTTSSRRPARRSCPPRNGGTAKPRPGRQSRVPSFRRTPMPASSPCRPGRCISAWRCPWARRPHPARHRYARCAGLPAPISSDAVVRSPRRIFLLANKDRPDQRLLLRWRGPPDPLPRHHGPRRTTTDLAAMMRTDLPNSAIQVSSVNDNVVLSGNVASAMEVARAVELRAIRRRPEKGRQSAEGDGRPAGDAAGAGIGDAAPDRQAVRRRSQHRRQCRGRSPSSPRPPTISACSAAP